MIKKILLALLILNSLPVLGQVKIDSLWFNGVANPSEFDKYNYCNSNSLLIDVDTGTTGGFQYQWSIYRSDSVFSKNILVIQSTNGNSGRWIVGVPDLDSIFSGFKAAIASQPYGRFLFETIIADVTSGDTLRQPFAVFQNPPVTSANVFFDGSDVFNSPSQKTFDTTFPGMWVDHRVPAIDVYFGHGNIEYYRVKLIQLDSVGNFVKLIYTDFDQNRKRLPFYPFFRNFALNEHIVYNHDKLINNTGRSYYRFTLYYGNIDCGEDSIYTYLRVIDPKEFDLSEYSGVTASFFPNPIKDKLRYSNLPEVNGRYTFELIDMNGKAVLEKTLGGTEGNIPMQLISGFYLYHLKDENGKVVQVGKLVVE